MSRFQLALAGSGWPCFSAISARVLSWFYMIRSLKPFWSRHMTNEHEHPRNPRGDHSEAGFERQDLGSTAVYVFFVAIVVGAALVALVLRGTLYFAQHWASEHQATVASPLL